MLSAQSLRAQDTPAPAANSVEASADTLGTALLYEFQKDYDVVFKAVKEALTSVGYDVNYASKKKNLIETSYKILAKDEDDDFFDVMSEYGDVPYIRSPGWKNGRTKISVTFEQLQNGKVAVKVLAILSGFEARFTNQWHYWKSNGKLEEEAMNAIVASVEAAHDL